MTLFGNLPLELRLQIFNLAAQVAFRRTWLPHVHSIIRKSQDRWEVLQDEEGRYQEIIVSKSSPRKVTMYVSTIGGWFYRYELVAERMIWREEMTKKGRRGRRRKTKIWMLHREREATGVNFYCNDGSSWQHRNVSYREIL